MEKGIRCVCINLSCHSTFKRYCASYKIKDDSNLRKLFLYEEDMFEFVGAMVVTLETEEESM